MADLITELRSITAGFDAVTASATRAAGAVAAAAGPMKTGITEAQQLTQAMTQAAAATAAAGQATGSSYLQGERSHLEDIGNQFAQAYGSGSFVSQLITDSFQKADNGTFTLQQAIDEIRGMLRTYQVGFSTLTDMNASQRDRDLAQLITAFEYGGF